MDAKKETRHFVRDRCNFNKKKENKIYYYRISNFCINWVFTL